MHFTKFSRRANLFMLPLAASLILVACDDDEDTDADATTAATTAASAAATDVSQVTEGQFEIVDPWARSTPGNPDESSAAYMIINNSGEADRLIGARWEGGLASEVQIHEMIMDGGQMKMNEVEGWDVPSGGSLELAPGGNHIMLIGLSEQLNPDDMISLTLIFEHAGEVTIDVPVREATGASSGGMSMGSATAEGGMSMGSATPASGMSMGTATPTATKAGGGY